MCGIIGYIGMRGATPVLLEGLKRMEYRGYDSAGVAVMNGAEPSAKDIAAFEHDLRTGAVRALIFNSQTSGSLAERVASRGVHGRMAAQRLSHGLHELGRMAPQHARGRAQRRRARW